MDTSKGSAKTLFDPDFIGFLDERGYEYPYSLVLQGLSADGEHFHEDEISVFQHVAEHEYSLYEPRGLLAGDLKVRTNAGIIDVGTLENPFRLPEWIEDDAVELVSCGASGIVLVENDSVFREMCREQAWRRLSMLLATGCGVPRLELRRFLHRLCQRFVIPTYLVADNDTWGYFIFSLLKRGTLAPHAVCKQTSIPDLRYLGVLAHDADQFDVSSDQRRNWEPQWSLRMEYLKRYSCFESDAWQRELARFELNHLSCDLRVFVRAIGMEKFIVGYLSNRIANQSWIG